MDKIFYTNAELTEKSGVPQGSDLPQDNFELLEFDLSSLPSGLTIYDIEWTSEGVTTDLDSAGQVKVNETLRVQYKTERDEALYSATVELDGMVFQTRPSDLSNFQTGIQLGQTRWILADNTIADVTVGQLQDVLNIGTTQANNIYNEYMDKIIML